MRVLTNINIIQTRPYSASNFLCVLAKNQQNLVRGLLYVVYCGRSACLTLAQRVFAPPPHGRVFVKKMFAIGAAQVWHARLDPA